MQHQTTSSTSRYPAFMNHPFWNLLRIDASNQDLSDGLRKLSPAETHTLVTEAVQGFYPISYASLLSFKRFSELADNPESKAIAHEIYMVESGERPLVEGAPLTGVRHCDQLKIMFESLLKQSLPISEPETYAVIKQANITNADIIKSMAICDLIESTAPYVIHFYQDFLIQCQIALRIPSEQLERSYLDEHNLTEGDACEDQHIAMLAKMKGNYASGVNSTAYATAQAAFIALVEQHFDKSYHKMQALLA
jgi:hypothetical protein